MKQNGLQYRFTNKQRSEWIFWNRCLWCGEYGWDALHHIISPSSMHHIPGDFNNSILNSCPIHNDKCHLYNNNLHRFNNEKKLLQTTYKILINKGYKLNDKDKEFISNYNKYYEDIRN